MRLNKEDYRRAEGCLIYYNYNCATILSKKNDTTYLSAIKYDGMPKAPYSISDPTARLAIKASEDEHYQKALKQYKAVELTKLLVSPDCLVIFERFYRNRENKWKIIHEEGYSEETFKRRKRELIYQVHEELKKVDPILTQFWPFLFKNRGIISISKMLFIILKRAD